MTSCRYGKSLKLFVGFMCLMVQACAVMPDKPEDEHQCIQIGQEWRYDHRAVDEGSRVVIVDVSMTKDKKRIYIVRVTGVRIDHPGFMNYFPDKIAYFYITEKGLRNSLTTLIGQASWNRYYDRHYKNWRRENKRGGYFGSTVKEKINTLEDILNVQLGA